MKIEGSFIELTLRREKGLLCCCYNPKSSQISHHLKEIGKDLDVLTSKYDDIIPKGDFNAEPANTAVFGFFEIYNLENIIRKMTCFKNPNNPSYIDVMITNKPSFQNSMVTETGIFDFHKKRVTLTKTHYSK